MKRSTVLGVALAAITGLTAWSAQAQSPRRDRNLDAGTRITVVDETGRARTRITVRRRSFLDPGTEVSRAFADHYHDYAVPPNFSVYHDRNDFKGSFSRMPLPGPFDLPGYNWN